jgi:hypothetical protein
MLSDYEPTVMSVCSFCPAFLATGQKLRQAPKPLKPAPILHIRVAYQLCSSSYT